MTEHSGRNEPKVDNFQGHDTRLISEVFTKVIVGKSRIEQIIRLADQLESSGGYIGHARVFAKSGEWAHSFKEVYYAAIADGDFYVEEQVELEQLNSFFAQDDYLSKYCGFPLS